MSHFTALVITGEKTIQGFDEVDECEKLLAPYDENTESAPRPEPCYCLEMDASQHTNSGRDWGKMGEAMADCDDCKGSGTRITTYNEASKWDWYAIGGRWEGEITEDYDPAQDIRNYSECEWCKGTGLRSDQLGKDARAEDPDYGCNGCDGSYKEGQKSKLPNGKSALGWRRNWSNAETEHNVQIVSNIPKNFKPFAYVTPDYQWHERARMGWFGSTTDDNDEFDKEWEGVLSTYNDHVAVLVDCHI